MGCPPCTVFGSLFNSNVHKMDPSVVKAKIREGVRHVMFCIELYKEQLRAGRYFLHEHPWPAWSWRLPGMQDLKAMPGVILGKGHMCRHGMLVDTPGGKELALKATGFFEQF